MARIQMNYPGVGNASMDIFIPEYSGAEERAGITEEDFYGGKFPVLWLLHGEGENCSDWFRFTLLEEYAAQAGIAVVCPTIENSFGVNVKRGDPWESFLTGNLRTAVYSMFPFSEKREDNFIAGISMGGYAALRLALRYPALYSIAGSIDGILSLEEDMLSYWWNRAQLDYIFGEQGGEKSANYQLLLLPKAEKEKPAIYLTCDKSNRQFEENRKMKKELDQNGYESILKETDGEDEGSERRNRQLKEMLLWISRKRNGEAQNL